MQSLPENDNVSVKEIARVVNELIRNLSGLDPTINPNCGKVEPLANLLRSGKLAYANGSEWDPGSGEGFYYRNAAGNWVQL